MRFYESILNQIIKSAVGKKSDYRIYPKFSDILTSYHTYTFNQLTTWVIWFDKANSVEHAQTVVFFLESGSTLFALACLSKYLGYIKCPKISNILFHTIIGIKHGFSCINIRQVPREVLKTEAGGRGFQHLPGDLANVNALKKHIRSLVSHKNWKHLLHFALFLALFLFFPFHRCSF